MEIQKYLGNLVDLFNRQKMLFIIASVTLIMIISVAGMSLIGSDSAANHLNRSPLNQTTNSTTPASIPASNQIPPLPTDAPLTTKFIYFVGGLFNSNKKTAQTPSPNTTANTYLPGPSTTSTAAPISQSPVSQTTRVSGGSTGADGSSKNSGGSSGGQSSSSNPPVATPTPATIINIVFKDENGEYWTYVPPDTPPIDTEWVKYTNSQDHYSIEYPANWIVVKSNYNGHEGITLYMPGIAGDTDKPSIAFVGWKADYLAQSASYTGTIVLNGTKGIIYTNGPFGPSSVSAVFQYQYGYFALGSSISNDIFMYVFDHMLRSLNFNI